MKCHNCGCDADPVALISTVVKTRGQRIQGLPGDVKEVCFECLRELTRPNHEFYHESTDDLQVCSKCGKVREEN